MNGVSIPFVMIVLGILPARIAADKGYDLLRWWMYGTLLFPVALVHSILLKRKLW